MAGAQNLNCSLFWCHWHGDFERTEGHQGGEGGSVVNAPVRLEVAANIGLPCWDTCLARPKKTERGAHRGKHETLSTTDSATIDSLGPPGGNFPGQTRPLLFENHPPRPSHDSLHPKGVAPNPQTFHLGLWPNLTGCNPRRESSCPDLPTHSRSPLGGSHWRECTSATGWHTGRAQNACSGGAA